MYGKQLRLSRLFNYKSGKICIVPIDHGITIGPVEGIHDYERTIKNISSGGADAVILHKGLLKNILRTEKFNNIRYILHLSASTILNDQTTNKVLIATVEEALKLGAEGVSVHVNLGTEYDSKMLKDLAKISNTCFKWGMPLLAMMYTFKKPKETYNILHASRIAEELGADIIKIEFPDSIDELEKIVNIIKVPIVIAGGQKQNDTKNLLYMIHKSLEVNIAGVAIGRNVFQFENPAFLTSIISQLIHGEADFNETISKLNDYLKNSNLNPVLL